MRFDRGVLLAAVLFLPALSGCASTSSASCAAPIVTVSSSRFHPGDSVTLTGNNFFDQCHHTGQGRADPARNIPIDLIADEGSIGSHGLASLDADRMGRFQTKVTIPKEVVLGNASIRVGTETTVVVESVSR